VRIEMRSPKLKTFLALPTSEVEAIKIKDLSL